MYNSKLENKLILPDITSVMGDYVALQEDIDSRKVKAAQLMAQELDIKRIIKKVNLDRVISDDELTGADLELKELLIAPLCYYTYARLLLNFQGTYTDGGYTTDELAASLNEAKSNAKEMKSVAETLMLEVIDFLELEDPNTEADEKKLTPKVRVFGGEEHRATN